MFSHRLLIVRPYLQLHIQTFAIRFGDAEGAKEFETAFKAGQEEMKTILAGLDSKQGKEEADAAADAVAALSVGGEGEKSEETSGK